MSIPAAPQSSAAYRGALLALQQQQRARLQLLIQQTEGALAADWTRGPGIVAQYYAPVIDAYAKALNDLRIAEDDPAAKLSMSWLTSQNAQLASIEQSVRASMLNYGQQAAKTVEDAQLAALAKGQQDAEALTQEALAPAWEKGVNPAMLWNRPNPDAIAAWAGHAGNGHPLGDLFANFAPEATHEARQVLLMSLATGANPKTLVTGLQQAMGISRSRALTISRTELLGSYRTAAHESYRANADVLQGWLWSAGGNNPCAMCAGMDGTLHDLYEELVDHPCGKCAPLPVTKSWDDILGPLGIDTSDMEETSIGAPGNYTSISDKFDSYSPEKQRAIIGTQTGYEAYRRGEVSLKDFIGVRPAEGGWPSQYYQRSLKELQIPTRQASRLVELRPDLMAKYQAGKLRASDLGKFTPYEQLPKWAQQSREAEIVYQILRNGLPYNMTSHEQGLLITNLEQMLKGELPVNVRAAAERQLLALGQSVERQTVGAATKSVAEQTAARDAFSVERLTAEQLDQEVQRAMAALHPDAREAEDFKADVAAALGKRLANNPDFMAVGKTFEEILSKDAHALYLGPGGFAIDTKTPEGIASLLVRVWASGDSPLYALQQAVRDEFGLTDLARLPGTREVREALATWKDVQPGLRAFVREMYNNTQDWLREQGITEMPLFRGMGWEKLPKALDPALLDGQQHEFQLTLRAASSFTADAGMAASFAMNPAVSDVDAWYQLAVGARVPASMILATPQTGFGSLMESEVLTLGGTFDVRGIGLDLKALEFEQIIAGARAKLTDDEVLQLLMEQQL